MKRIRLGPTIISPAAACDLILTDLSKQHPCSQSKDRSQTASYDKAGTYAVLNGKTSKKARRRFFDAAC